LAETSPNPVEFGFHGAWPIGAHPELQLEAGLWRLERVRCAGISAR
jgi:hypothetical protein